MKALLKTHRPSHCFSALIAFRGCPSCSPRIRGSYLCLSGQEIPSNSPTSREGREVVILETSGNWVQVEANLTEERNHYWLDARQKGVVRTTTSERRTRFSSVRQSIFRRPSQPQSWPQREPRRTPCAFTIELLNIFPTSPLAGEAMYRSADIRWQNREGRRHVPVLRQKNRKPICAREWKRNT